MLRCRHEWDPQQNVTSQSLTEGCSFCLDGTIIQGYYVTAGKRGNVSEATRREHMCIQRTPPTDELTTILQLVVQQIHRRRAKICRIPTS